MARTASSRRASSSVELPPVARRVAGLGRVGAWPGLHLGDRLAAQRDRQVVALPRLLKRRQRLGRLPALVADHAEIECGFALAEVDGRSPD